MLLSRRLGSAATTSDSFQAVRAALSLPLVWLVGAYVVLSLLYLHQAQGHPTPWLFPDELQYAQLARSVAGSQIGGYSAPHSIPTLYAYLTAPAWFFPTVSASYQLAKAIGVLVMTATLFPAYGLVRTFASAKVAAVAAITVVCVPALAYSSLIIEEPLAYPVFALGLWAIHRALLQRTRRWIIAAAVISIAAVFVRAELLLLPVIAVLTAAAHVFLWPRPAVPNKQRLRALAISLATTAVAAVALDVTSRTFRDGIAHPVKALDYGVWAIGALMIGTAVLPAVAALAFLVRPPARATEAEHALWTLALASLLAFFLYTAIKAAHVSTLSASRVEERDLVYLTVPMIASAAAFSQHRRPSLTATVVAAGLVAYTVIATPYLLGIQFYSDALGPNLLQRLVHDGWLSHTSTQIFLVVIAVAAFVVIAASRWMESSRWTVLVGVCSIFVIGWSLATEISAADVSNQTAREYRQLLPPQPEWITGLVGNKSVVYAGTDISDPTNAYGTAFWNPAVAQIVSIGRRAAQIGPIAIETARPPRCILNPPLDAFYAATEPGTRIVGTSTAKNEGITLQRVHRPLRLEAKTAAAIKSAPRC